MIKIIIVMWWGDDGGGLKPGRIRYPELLADEGIVLVLFLYLISDAFLCTIVFSSAIIIIYEGSNVVSIVGAFLRSCLL